MKKVIFIGGLIIAAELFAFTFMSSKKHVVQPVQKLPLVHKGVAVLELFTSQGCSSCPAADELLGKYALQNDPAIITLAFHVDYWDRLGWKDPFSTAGFTSRQKDYAKHYNLDGVYTPQLIVNGQKEMVGSEEDKVAAAINSSLTEAVTADVTIGKIELAGNDVSVGYTAYNSTDGIIQAVLVQKMVITNVKAGENNGVQLKNYNVVRDFISTEKNEGKVVLHLPKGAISTDYGVVIFLQDKESFKIKGAAIKNIN